MIGNTFLKEYGKLVLNLLINQGVNLLKKTSKTSHKLFKAALATTVATGAFVAAVPAETNAAVSFKDVTNPAVHYYKPVLELAERGVVKGYDDGTYRPNTSVTRAQSAKILAHVLGLDTVNVKDPGFADVKKDTPYYGPVAALANAGYIKGYEEKGVKTYKPNNNMTRSQMAKILTLGFDLEEKPLAADRFKDVKPKDAYAGYVAALLAHNITTGTTPTTFSPNGLVTRGQMATFVVRTETALKEGTPEVPDLTGSQLLQKNILAELAKVNSATDLVNITLNGNVFNVDIKESTSTIKDFSAVAKPVFNELKKNTVIDTATITIMIGGSKIEIKEENIDNNQDFDTVMKKVLGKTGMSETTALTILKGKTITLNVVGLTDSKPFNSTYEFKF